MSLAPPPKVRKLQETLHAKAKGSPGYRFYVLYDKVYRRDVLEFAYDRCRANGGAPGIDGQTFEDIEAYGLDRWLDELADRTEKRRRTDPQPVRRVLHPERRMANNGRWGSGRSEIAWRRWRWCWSWSRSSRPTWSRSNTPTGPNTYALDAVRQVHGLLNSGHTEVVDADLSGYFDSIPHAELMKSVSRRDQRSAPAGADQDVAGSAGGRGRRAGAAPPNDPQQGRGPGHPAGLSSFAAVGECLYASVRPAVGRRWGTRRRLDARIVNYADDFVICCRGTADEAMTAMRSDDVDG